MFVGAERRQLVEMLLDAFQGIQEGEGPRLELLVAPPGAGKTRIIQELYAALAARQSQPPYWPPRIDVSDEATVPGILQDRKRIYPSKVHVPEKAHLDWMWWGILCHQRDSGEYAAAMFDDATQLYAHAEAFLAVPGKKELAGATSDVADAAISVLGLLGLAIIPPVGAALTVVSAARTVWAQHELVARLKSWAKRHHDELHLDAASHGLDERIEELARDFARLSAATPIVMVIDDAHYADRSLVSMLDKVLANPQSRVLVVASSWPQVLAEESSDETARSPFVNWWHEHRTGPMSARLHRSDLSPLPADDIAQLVTAEVPFADPGLIEAVRDKIGDNPLAVLAALRLPPVRRAIAQGSLGAKDVAAMPHRVEDIFAAYFDELPVPVQQVLTVANKAGVQYLPQVVIAVATAQGIADAKSALRDAVNPYAWVRELDEYLQSFIDPTFCEIAQRGGETFSGAERDQIRRSLNAAVLEVDTSTLSPRARAAVQEQHVTLAREGLVACDGRASVAAWELAQSRASRYEYPSAIQLVVDAIAWSEDDADSDLRFEQRVAHAWWLAESGRLAEAIAQGELLVADQKRVLGPDHPDTLRTRNDLALWLAQSGRLAEAITQFELLLADQERVLGPDDPDTLRTRSNLAFSFNESGRLAEAIAQGELLLADQERVLGPDHPDILTTRSNLAFSLAPSGRLAEAIAQGETLLADQMRVLGPDDPDTLRTRHNLAGWLGGSGRLAEAITQGEALLADRARVLGPDHPDTLTTRNNLAFWLGETGRSVEAITQFEALLADRTRVLGPDHPDTLTTRYNLAFWLGETGRSAEAIARFEALLADQMRVLGPDHPDTLQTRDMLEHRPGS